MKKKEYTKKQIDEAIRSWTSVLEQLDSLDVLKEELIDHTTMGSKAVSRAKLIKAKYRGRDVVGRPFNAGDIIVYFPGGHFQGADSSGKKTYSNVYVKPEDMHNFPYMDAAREMLMKKYHLTADEFKNLGKPRTSWRGTRMYGESKKEVQEGEFNRSPVAIGAVFDFDRMFRDQLSEVLPNNLRIQVEYHNGDVGDMKIAEIPGMQFSEKLDSYKKNRKLSDFSICVIDDEKEATEEKYLAVDREVKNVIQKMFGSFSRIEYPFVVPYVAKSGSIWYVAFCSFGKV